MIDNPTESADTESSINSLPKVDGQAFAELLKSDDSALATAVRNMIQMMESSETNYAEFGNVP